jgi:hypothetical protein
LYQRHGLQSEANVTPASDSGQVAGGCSDQQGRETYLRHVP